MRQLDLREQQILTNVINEADVIAMASTQAAQNPTVTMNGN